MMQRLIVFSGLLALAVTKPLTDDLMKQYIKAYMLLHPNKDVNNPEYGDLPQGDLEGDVGKIGAFNAITETHKKWPDNTVYYSIRKEQYTQEELNKIKAGIDDLVNSVKVNGQNCIQIVERTDQANYVDVYQNSGCSSYLGMIGGAQRISLTSSCVNRHGTIMHEFLHALGFHHEHKRGDRNLFVYVNNENIQEGKEHNFTPLVEGDTVDHLSTSYDYGSVLHYSAYGFAIDKTVPTIVPLDPQAEIGQRTHVSQLDIERVQIFYNCLSPENSTYFKHLAAAGQH